MLDLEKTLEGCQACRNVFVILLVTFALEFDLTFEISDGNDLVKFGRRTFLPARKAREISEQISRKFSETSFQFRDFFRKLRSAERRC